VQPLRTLDRPRKQSTLRSAWPFGASIELESLSALLLAIRPSINYREPLFCAFCAPFRPASERRLGVSMRHGDVQEKLQGTNVNGRQDKEDGTPLDDLLSRPVSELVGALDSQDLNLACSFSAVAKCLDMVCEYVGSKISMSESAETSTMLQQDLQRTYEALAKRGILRGFNSCTDALLPLDRELENKDQEKLTGLSSLAFARSRGGGEFTVIIAFAWLAVALIMGPAPTIASLSLVAILVADRFAFSGVVFESIARIVQPARRKQLVQHEAGHFLLAYLLGNPVQACLLDVWSTSKEGITAGTVFFDTELGASTKGRLLSNKLIDRYSVVVMAGIAAEVLTSGKTVGGAADELALGNFLGEGTKISRIVYQARWGVTQAFLLLREHKSAYDALCEALEKGASVGEAIVAIEKALPPDELPSDKRKPKESVPISVSLALNRAELTQKSKALEDKLAIVDKRLVEIMQRLSELQ